MPYRPTERTRRRAADKKEALLRAALGIVSEHGFAGTKVTAIAEECGISVGSIYTHFDNRDELLAEVFRSAARHELAAVRTAVMSARPAARDRLDALIFTFSGRALRSRTMAWSLLFEPVSPVVENERLTHRHAYVELGEHILRDGIAEGTYPAQNVTLSASATMGAISEALIGRLNPIGTENLSNLSDELVIEQIRTYCHRAWGSPIISTPLLEENLT